MNISFKRIAFKRVYEAVRNNPDPRLDSKCRVSVDTRGDIYVNLNSPYIREKIGTVFPLPNINERIFTRCNPNNITGAKVDSFNRENYTLGKFRYMSNEDVLVAKLIEISVNELHLKAGDFNSRPFVAIDRSGKVYAHCDKPIQNEYGQFEARYIKQYVTLLDISEYRDAECRIFNFVGGIVTPTTSNKAEKKIVETDDVLEVSQPNANIAEAIHSTIARIGLLNENKAQAQATLKNINSELDTLEGSLKILNKAAEIMGVEA